MRPRRTAVALGAAAGLVSGLLGVGGGIVMVPGLVVLLHLTQRRAHATSLAAIIPIGAVGALGFGLGGRINYSIALAMSVGAVLGAPLGVRLMSGIPERVLRFAFVAAALVAGVRLLV